jgi:UDP-N-acetyl-D-galactosamine dehydrogenase
MGAEGIRAFGNADSVVYDIKYLLPSDAADDRL